MQRAAASVKYCEPYACITNFISAMYVYMYIHSSNYVKIGDEMSKQKSVNTLHVYLGIKQSMCTLDIE